MIYQKMESFFPELNRDNWPTTAESYANVPYGEFVQPQKAKKLGTRFIKISSENEIK